MHVSPLIAKILLATAVAAVWVGSTAAQDPRSPEAIRQAQQETTAELLQIIQREGLDDVKAAAFEQLAVFATPEAIPVLIPLLADEQLAHYARFALQPIPDAAVDDAFRHALDQLSGKLLIGVINSIGVRKDAQAVEALAQKLGDQDPEIVAAAAAALGAIANPHAATVLKSALEQAADTHRVGVARGCLLCAENLGSAGSRDEAIALYDLVRAAEVTKSVRMAALRGAILARQEDAVTLVVEQLQGSDAAAVDIALRAARELESPEVRTALRTSLGSLSPHHGALVLLALGDLGDRDSLPIVAAAAAQGTPEVRLAAITALAKIGDVTVLPTLWAAALAPNPSLSEAAIQTLHQLPGEKVDAAILSQLDRGDDTSRRLAIDLIRQRRITDAVPKLLEIAQGSKPDLRLAAIEALGETASLEKLPQLVDWVIASQDEQEKSLTRAALNAACVRMPDRDTCAKTLTSRLATAPDEMKIVLLEQLGSMGGPVALQCLADSAADSASDTQDAATRILGEWVGSDVGPVLLELAQSIKTEKYKIRVLRGYIRIANQFGLPHDEKMEMCQRALALAQRDDERELVLNVLQSDPSPIALRLAVSQLNQGGLRNRAAGVAVAIAPRAIQDDPKAVAEAMQKVIDASVGGDIEQQARAFLDRATKAP